MIKTEIEVEGLEELEKRLLAISADMAGKNVRNSLMKAGKVVFDDMKANVKTGNVTRKVKTDKGGTVTISPGFLKSRIKRRSRLNRTGQARGFKGDSIVSVSIGVYKVPYVAAVEYGAANRGVRAQPFIRRALENNVDQVISTFKADLKRRLDEGIA